MTVRFRGLRLSDYDAMIDLFRICGLIPRESGRDGRSAIAAQLRARTNQYFGAFDGRRLVGTVLGTHDTRKGWINRLAVYPAYRRRGIAARLVRMAERGLRDQGIEIFTVLIEPGNRASAAVFRTLGYEFLPVRYARRELHPGA